MLFADSLLLLILRFTPVPIFAVMGGVRFSESDQILAEAAFLASLLALLSWPVWLIAAIIATVAASWKYRLSEDDQKQRSVSRSAWWLAIASLALWLLALPFTQQRQFLRYRVEQRLHAGKTREALLLMSAHELADFLPHWDPPLKIGYSNPYLDVVGPRPDIVEIQSLADELPLKPWVRECFRDKFARSLEGLSYRIGSDHQSFQRLRTQLDLLQRLPDAKGAIESLEWDLRNLKDDGDVPDDIRERAIQPLGRAEANSDRK